MVTSALSQASTTGMNGVIISGCVPARGGPVGGTEAASSARYLRTVRQSQPHSRPISTNVAPAACRARKRRIFIQDSVSRIMSRAPFGLSAWRWTTEGSPPHSGGRGLNAPRPTYTSGRTENDISGRTRTLHGLEQLGVVEEIGPQRPV